MARVILDTGVLVAAVWGRLDLAVIAEEDDVALPAVALVEYLTGVELDPDPASRAYHWVGYGRALAQLREHHGEAVRVLRMAESVHPHRVLRDPFVRDAVAGLLRSSRRGSSTDQELRGMARRAGLPV